ncbi:ExeA family protein [Pseudoduganella namucuonensis]|uniref:Type II secretion system protein A n=1 Tax=Pseudoduganella namucuonensis TaxID=1035707 RepID=A0A1I7I6W4_9BURK|nr:ExeA family protein [Pseudoduganella namucuonensis]SFU68641.1 type II secretion system protein A [Pseudoduganella namucuonensis]
MYTQFFQLKQSPFSIAPDPRYLYMSERHREALAHLLYGVEGGGGFVLLTGEIGAGKTTVCRCFMEQIPAHCELGYIFNPKLTVEELLLSVCDEFRIELPEGTPGARAVSVKGYVDAINRHLLDSHAAGRNSVLIIDEAQNLSADVLEQLRLLTNLETSERKLLQIILIGQPELRAMLARPELEQLAQRVIARYHLGSLSVEEAGSYIEHRLAVAGAHGPLFPRGLMPHIHQLTKGVPRRINLLCDRALLGAYVENAAQVTRGIVRKAAREVFAADAAGAGTQRRWPAVAAGVLAGAALTAAAAWQLMPPAAPVVVTSTSVSGTGQDTSPAAGGAARVDRPTAVAPASPRAGNALAQSGRVPTGPGPVGGAPAAMAVGQLPFAAHVPATVPGAARDTSLAAHLPAAMARAGHDTGLAVRPPGPGAGLDTSQAALRQLASLWGQAVPDGEFCASAARLNLRCLHGKGALDELRLLDRPAVLKLNDDPVAPRYGVLTSLSSGGATLAVAGKQETLSLQALAARYDGSYTTLWRAPRAWRDEVSAGDRGPDVDWLAKRLAALNGARKPQENQPLDGTTQARLREFQVSQKLKADGVAGPKTFIRLSQLGGVQEPRLLAPGAAGK